MVFGKNASFININMRWDYFLLSLSLSVSLIFTPFGRGSFSSHPRWMKPVSVLRESIITMGDETDEICCAKMENDVKILREREREKKKQDGSKNVLTKGILGVGVGRGVEMHLLLLVSLSQLGFNNQGMWIVELTIPRIHFISAGDRNCSTSIKPTTPSWKETKPSGIINDTQRDRETTCVPGSKLHPFFPNVSHWREPFFCLGVLLS